MLEHQIEVLVGEIVNTRSTEENGGNDRVADVQVSTGCVVGC